jgi:hypothetical protein
MNILLALSIYIIVIAVHRLYCQRCNEDKMHAKQVIVYSFVGLLAYILLATIWVLNDLFFSGLIFYILLVPTYLIIYVTMYLESPSRLILESLAEGDLTYDQLLQRIAKAQFIQKRLIELQDARLVYQQQDKLVLSPQGFLLARLYALYAKILAARMGG